MLQTDDIIGQRYRIVTHISSGGMSTVYRATDNRLNVSVALKHRHPGPDTQSDTEFEREAQILAGLHDSAPEAVKIHLTDVKDYLIDSQYGQFIVMEFVPGEDLGDRLAKTGSPFPLTSVLQWAEDLLRVLNYLHEHNPPIIHYDIKPKNLKLKQEKVVLLDFGSAREAQPQIPSSSQGQLYATPIYAAPELLKSGTTGPRSDLYALGATLYHLLSAHEPPSALEREAALLAGEPDPLEPLYKRYTAVQRSVSSVIEQAMALDARQRFTSAGEMLIALKNTNKTGPLSTSPSFGQTSFSRLIVLAVAIVLVISIAIAILFAVRGSIVTQTPQPAAETIPATSLPQEPTQAPTSVSATSLASVAPEPLPTAPLSPSPTPSIVALVDTVLFVSRRDGNSTIYAINDDGSNERPLIDRPGQVTSPSLAPDGRHIAFVSNRDGNNEMYLSNSDSSDIHPLALQEADGIDPTWSPDGTQIAFASLRDGDYEIYIIRADGTDLKQLTNNNNRDVAPAWSPDGRYIAFESSREGNIDIYRIEIATKQEDRMTRNEARDQNPAWSPDSRFIVFQSDQNQKRGFDLYTLDTSNASDPVPLTNAAADDTDPVWPSNGSVYFVSRRDGYNNIYALQVDSLEVVPLTQGSNDNSDPN